MSETSTMFHHITLVPMKRLTCLFLFASTLVFGQLPVDFIGPAIAGALIRNPRHAAKRIFKHAKLTIRLKNDSIITLKAEFNASTEQDSVMVRSLNGTPIDVYRPEDTKSIVRQLPGGGDLKGIPADSCWYFKIIEGKIRGYSDVPVWSEDDIVAFSVGDGDILPLTQANFQAIAPAEDKHLERFIRKRMWVEAIHYYNRYVK
jgi:hypothetical protein